MVEPGHYGQDQNASSTTAATVVCITSGMSIVNRFIGSAAESSAQIGPKGLKGRSGVSRGLSTIAITDIERLLPHCDLRLIRLSDVMGMSSARFGDRRADEHGLDLAGAERPDRLRSRDVIPVACNSRIQRSDRGPFVGDFANPGRWRPSRNCNRRCVLDRQPDGLSSRRLSSTRPAISATSPQGTKPRSQRRRRQTAMKAPICDSNLTPLRPVSCLRDEHRFSCFVVPL